MGFACSVLDSRVVDSWSFEMVSREIRVPTFCTRVGSVEATAVQTSFVVSFDGKVVGNMVTATT